MPGSTLRWGGGIKEGFKRIESTNQGVLSCLVYYAFCNAGARRFITTVAVYYSAITSTNGRAASIALRLRTRLAVYHNLLAAYIYIVVASIYNSLNARERAG